MSDYKRLFSYLYYYEQESKEKNSGFLKVEIRNGQCRAQISVKGGFLNRASRWGVYGFKREEEGLCLWPLGDLTLRPGQGEWTGQMAQSRFLGRADCLDQVAGVMLCAGADEDGVYIPDLSKWSSNRLICATVWDDLPLFAAKEVLHAAGIAEYGDPEPPAVTAAETGLEEWEVLRGLLEEREVETIMTDRQLYQGNEQEPEDGYRCGHMYQNFELPQMDGSKEDSPDQEEYDSPEGSNAFQPEQEPEEASAPAPQTTEPQISENVVSDAAEWSETEEESEDLERRRAMRSGQGDRKKCPCPGQCMWREQHREPPRNVWESLSRQYPKLLLNGLGSGWEILKIMPGDIGRLPRENWVYGNNSFLLHGYYRYHHLILACYRGTGHEQYYLGVPGPGHGREQVMASMFGFMNYLPAGKYGYWYTPINLGNN